MKTRRFEGRFFGARAGRIVWLCALVAALAGVGVSAASTRPPGGGEPLPDVLVITVDTLRADHLSGYGYRRPTSPNLDRLFGAGALFLEARTTEPLTSPALCTMVTGVEPHVHGSTRNGLSMRAGLPSLPKLLSDAGYRTGGFVGNWTLRDRLSGLGGHFERYETLVTRKRWFGLLKGEATGDDLNDALLEWLREIREDAAPRFAWIHYVEPHAPYRAWKEHLPALGLEDGNLSPLDRYDTEIAHVDRVIGDLLAAVRSEGLLRDPIIVFTSDHGESLGEHDYWGHGRNLHEPGLRIPLSITWPGKIDPEQVAGPSLLIDLPRTLASLVGLQAPDAFDGHDWSPTLLRGEPGPQARETFYQAHRGAVQSNQQEDLARKSGLLEVAVLRGGVKEIVRVTNGRRQVFDLGTDPGERNDLSRDRKTSESLQSWRERVVHALENFGDDEIEPLDEESIEKLRALGYLD